MTAGFSHSTPVRLNAHLPSSVSLLCLAVFVAVVCHHSCGLLGLPETAALKQMRANVTDPRMNAHLTTDLAFISVTRVMQMLIIDVVLSDFSALYLNRYQA